MADLLKEKNLKKLAAALFAGALTLGLVHATPASAITTVGSGVVDVYGVLSPAACAAQGFQPGCTQAGAGVVTPNPWNNNEVLTAYHVIKGLSVVQIYEPYSRHHDYAYVQRVNVAKDEAVLWIYKSVLAGVYKPSDVNYETSALADARPGLGSAMSSAGDSNNNYLYPGTPMAFAYGTVTNKNYPVVTPPGLTLYNTIQTTHMTAPGDSGGALINRNPASPNYLKVAGINQSSSPSFSYAIYIQTIYADMLGTRP